MSKPAAPRLDVVRLMEAINGKPIDHHSYTYGRLDGGPFKQVEHRTGIAARSWHRWRAQGGIPAPTVDAICCHHLGVHPASIYGAEWYDCWDRPALADVG